MEGQRPPVHLQVLLKVKGPAEDLASQHACEQVGHVPILIIQALDALHPAQSTGAAQGSQCQLTLTMCRAAIDTAQMWCYKFGPATATKLNAM